MSDTWMKTWLGTTKAGGERAFARALRLTHFSLLKLKQKARILRAHANRKVNTSFTTAQPVGLKKQGKKLKKKNEPRVYSSSIASGVECNDLTSPLFVGVHTVPRRLFSVLASGRGAGTSTPPAVLTTKRGHSRRLQCTFERFPA